MSLTPVKLDAQRAVAAAFGVLRDEGLAGLSMRAVAAKAGVTPPALYWHFQDKATLVRAVMGEARRLFRDRLTDSLTATTPLGRFRGALAAYRDLAVEDPHVFEALFVATRGPVRTRAAADGEEVSIFQLLVDRVSECMANGDFTRGDAAATALTVAALAQGAVLLYRRGRFRTAAEFARFFDESVDRLIAGLG